MQITDLQSDPIATTEILGFMQVHPEEINDPTSASQLRDIVKYFENAVDKRYVITKLLAGKNVPNPVNHLHTYITVRQEFAQKQKDIEKLRDELSIYER